MTSKKTKLNSRSRDNRPPRKITTTYYIATEGSSTEIEYLMLFDQLNNVSIKPVKTDTKSDPNNVLLSMTKRLNEEKPVKPYEAWLIIDVDNRGSSELRPLHNWQAKDKRYGFAVSNPCFELWLLLHFENGRGASSARVCTTRLKKYDKNYNKHINKRMYNRDNVKLAIRHAKQKDTQGASPWPKATGTTVYKLVEKFCNG